MYRQDFPPRPRGVHQDQPGRQEPHHRRLRHLAPHRPAQVRAAVPRQHGRVQPRGFLVEIPLCFDVAVLEYRYLEETTQDLDGKMSQFMQTGNFTATTLYNLRDPRLSRLLASSSILPSMQRQLL